MAEPIIDVHIHVGGPGGEADDDQSGCAWSDEFEHTEAYWAILLTTGTSPVDLTQKKITKKVLKTLKKAKVDKGVLLGLDRVHDPDGRAYGVDGPVERRSHLVVPNSYLARLREENPKKVLFGCSIHPYRVREDLEKEFRFCVERGAVLCKWIPSAQMIDPGDGKCERLYELLREHKIPLLSHCGPEPTVPTSYREDPEFAANPYRYNHPMYLKTPLEMGVTVIVAHCSVPYYGVFSPDYKMYLQSILELFKRAEETGWEWDLYADVSALCSLFISEDIIETIKAGIPKERLLLGSDFPVPAVHLGFVRKKPSLWELIKLHFANPITRNKSLLIDYMGFDRQILYNAHRVLYER